VSVIADRLNRSFVLPDRNLPLVLVDSEGMGVRGEDFDFIMSSPVAILAKVIIWVGEMNVKTGEILADLDKYLKGLDNIVMNNFTETECSYPRYGDFIVVINKLTDNTSDKVLQRELLTAKAQFSSKENERNAVRAKLNKCFTSVKVVGLPYLTPPANQSFGYPILTDRFRNGLKTMVDSILGVVQKPKIIKVGLFEMELNSTNAEEIVGTVIEESNKGRIDLAGFALFWTLVTNQVKSKLRTASAQLDFTKSKCNDDGECSACVCDFRNELLGKTLEEVESILEIPKYQAETFYEGVNVSEAVAALFAKIVEPWEEENRCNRVMASVDMGDLEVCDSSQMGSRFSTGVSPGESVSVTCGALFLCGNINVPGNGGNSVTVTTKR
jgi:hypothetical protein